MLAYLLVAAVTTLPLGSYVADDSGVVRVAGPVADAVWLDNETLLVIGGDGALYRCTADGEQKHQLPGPGRSSLHTILGISGRGSYAAAVSTTAKRPRSRASDTIHIVDTRSGRALWRATRAQTEQLDVYGWVVWKDGSEQDLVVCWPPGKLLDTERGSIEGAMPACLVHLPAGTAAPLSLLPGTLWTPDRWLSEGLVVNTGIAGFTELLVPLAGGPTRVLPAPRVQYVSPMGCLLGERLGRQVVVYLEGEPGAYSHYRLALEEGRSRVVAEQEFRTADDYDVEFYLNNDSTVTAVETLCGSAETLEGEDCLVRVSRGSVGNVRPAFQFEGYRLSWMNALIPSPAGDRLFVCVLE